MNENLSDDSFNCPNCGEELPANARFCKYCGSDENTGWSEGTYLDGIDMTDEESYDEMYQKEFGEKQLHAPPGIILIGAILLLAFLFLLVRNIV